MATAGEGRAPYESSGAGGKFRKRPFRRGGPATPYDRPATALRNNKPGLLTKLVDPASRLIYAGANKLFGVFRKRLPPLSLQGPPEINEEPQNVSQESGQNNSIGVSKRINQDGNSASISAATGISDLEQMLKQKTFTRSEIQHLTTLLHSRTTDSPSDNIAEIHGASPSPLLRIEASTSGSIKKHAAISTPFVSSKVSTPSPADVAKSYMGTITRPTTKLMNNTTPFQNTSITPKAANNFKNQENGFLITPRSHGRSAMYSMARTPYSRSPNQNTSHGTSLKRRSSVLEDDFGSVGPLRRTRQKPNLMLQSKKELGYTISQQPMLLKNKPEENGDTIMSKSKSTHVSVPEKSTQTAMKIFQQLESLTPKSPTKLTSNMLNGQALRSLEKVDSVKYLQTSQCNGESASTSRGKEKVEENGSRKFPVPFNMLTTSTNGNGDVAVLKESAQAVAIDDDDNESALKLPPEPPQKKRAFQMSVTEIDDDDDDDDVEDDDDVINVNGHVSFPPVENNNKLEISPVVNKPVSADIIEVTTPPEVFKTPAPVEATPVVVEAAKVLEPEKAKPPPKTDGFFGEKETGFKFSSTFTAHKDEVTPAQKVSPFQFSEYKSKESSEPKPINSTSVFSSETKNDQFKVTNTDNKKLETIPAAMSASGMFSISSSAKNSSGPAVTPDSTPSVFSSLASFPASGGSTSSLFNNTSNSNITPATTSSLSSPTPVFSFGSGKAITSMPESSNTEAVIEKEPKSTISSSPFFAATTTTAATTPSGGGLFGFSSPAAASTAATTTTTTNGGGLFGFSSPAATSTTTAANGGGGLFGFSAPAATSTTTTNTTSAATNGGGLFGSSAPAATSTAAAAANGGALFGFSSPAATSTTTTSTATNAGALFGFGAPAATSTTATATNGGSPFGFSAPATTSTTTTAASATNGGALFGFGAPPSTSTTTNATNSSALFGFSAPATTSTTTTTTTTASPLFGFSSPSPTNSFFNTTTTTSQTNPSSTTTTTQSAPFQFASGPTTSPTFGITPVSEGKSGNSTTTTTTTTVFGSSWQQPPPQNPPVFSFGASSSASTTPITFGAPKTTPSSSSSMFSFSSSSPVFPNNNNHITNGNDQMSMEDSMAEDSMQTPTPVPSPFGQPAAAPGFMFGAPVAAPPQAAAPAPFQFGGAAPQNPFQSSSVEFNGGGGSFSLGSGGEKAGRRIVRVNKSKNRRK